MDGAETVGTSCTGCSNKTGACCCACTSDACTSGTCGTVGGGTICWIFSVAWETTSVALEATSVAFSTAWFAAFQTLPTIFSVFSAATEVLGFHVIGSGCQVTLATNLTKLLKIFSKIPGWETTGATIGSTDWEDVSHEKIDGSVDGTTAGEGETVFDCWETSTTDDEDDEGITHVGIHWGIHQFVWDGDVCIGSIKIIYKIKT